MLRMGVEEIRLTGGEPLVRKDLPQLIRRLAPLDGLKSLSLTTNGYLLKEQAAAWPRRACAASTSRSTRSTTRSSTR